MTMAPMSQLSVPLSQNTAPVFKFDCLYTHDVVRKQKRWQDGVLAFHTFNKRVMVYDLTNNFIGDTHWRETDHVQEGDDLKLDRGVLVTVGEARGRKDQDISEIFAKRNGAATRETNLPPRKVVPGRATGIKPQSITAVLEASRKKLSRPPVAQIPSSISHGSSPYDIDSQRSPKRQKLANEDSPRQALIEKLPKNRVPVAIPSSHNRSELSAPRESKNARQEDGNRNLSRSSVMVSDRIVTSKPKQRPKDIEYTENTSSGTKKSRKKSERTKATNVNANLDTAEDTRNENHKQKSKIDDDAAKSRTRDYSAVDRTEQERPKQKLISSKSRRKKLIFNSIVSHEVGEAINKESYRSEQLDISEPLHRIVKETTQDVIPISSPLKEWTDFGDLADEDDGLEKYTKHAEVNDLTNILEKAEPDFLSEQGGVSINTPPLRITVTANDHNALQERPIDDNDGYSGLAVDDNLLAALAEDPVDVSPDDDHQRDIYLNTGNPIADDKEPINEDIRLASKKESSPPKLSRTEVSTPLSSFSCPSPSDTDQPLASPIQDTTLDVKHDIPPPITKPPDIPLLQTAIPPVHPSPQNEITNPPAQPIISAENNTTPLELPTSKPRTLRSIAPLPTLLRPPNQTTAQQQPPPITYQKPLPQFRPPQQTATTTTAAATTTTRSRRSPLRKSLTEGRPGSGTAESGGIGSLTRAGSDGGAEIMGDTQKEYEDVGPWSREAFDLFGWTPELPKGKILGPVAGRGCACRATAAAAAVGMAGRH